MTGSGLPITINVIPVTLAQTTDPRLSFDYLTTSSMTTTATINNDRFYADREVPFCGLDVAKSFEQLR